MAGAAEDMVGRLQAGCFSAKNEIFNLGFLFIRQLEAVRSKYLDPIVGIRVMRGGNDNSRTRPGRSGNKGNAGRRQDPDEFGVYAGCTHSGSQGVSDHVA
jgi:hypothetical protein